MAYMKGEGIIAPLKDNGNFEQRPHLDRTGRTSPLRQHGCVYYIRSEDTGRIKIGWSSNLPKRMMHLQLASASRLTVLFSEPGTGHDERDMHNKFRADRVHGEWFEASPRLLAHIEERRAAPPRKIELETGFSKTPAPEITLEERRARQALRREWAARPADYYDPGQPGWEKLKAAMRVLG